MAAARVSASRIDVHLPDSDESRRPSNQRIPCSVGSRSLRLQSAQEQADQQDKQQARLVNIWAADQFSRGRVLVTVANRSEEPIYQFRLYVAFATPGSGRYLAISTWSSFPPCIQITFDLRGIAE